MAPILKGGFDMETKVLHEGLVVVEPSQEKLVVIEAKNLAKIEPRFKRIDMAFLSMRLQNGLPRFACMHYSDYICNKICWIEIWEGDGVIRASYIMPLSLEAQGFCPRYHQDHLGRMIIESHGGQMYCAEPSSDVPRHIKKLVEE